MPRPSSLPPSPLPGRFLLIAGTTKGGTTSLYQHLRDHPEVCAAGVKETRFFLDPAYPLPSRYRFRGDPSPYLELFRDCPEGQLRLEATPDYLYDLGAAARIRDGLADPRVVITLRDPRRRLQSWYRFAHLTGGLDPALSFPDYLRLQLSSPVAPDTSQPLRALEQGDYSRYLRRWLETLGEERVLVVYLEKLAEDPRATMRAICRFAELEPSVYDDYPFAPHNVTSTLRPGRARRRLRYHLGNLFARSSRLRQLLRRLVPPRTAAKIPESRDLPLPPDLEAELDRRTAREARALTDLLGSSPPWDLVP